MIEDHGYIEVHDQFDEETALVKIVYATNQVVEEYNDFIRILKTPLEKDTAIDQFITGKMQNLSDGGLYPTK